MVDCMEVKPLDRQIGDSTRLVKSVGKIPVYTGHVYQTQANPSYRVHPSYANR